MKGRAEIARRLREGPCLLLDGGMGTQLIAAGLAAGHAPERWNLEHPDRVRAAHRAYVQAGSEAVHTNTFGGNAVRLAREGWQDRVDEVNAAGVALARAAGARFVIGDVGPTGEYLPPVGQADPSRWHDVFAAQAAALAAAGVDALHVETMSDLREVRAALDAIAQAAPGVPVLVSLTFDRKPRGFRTVMGVEALAAWRELAAAGPVAVGANCSVTSRELAELGRLAVAEGIRPVLQPNAGQPEAGPSGLRYAQEPSAFADDLAPLAAGAAALGGCCGTDPRFIAALAARPDTPWGRTS